MQGREAGTIGNVRATDYIAGELRRLGVEPAGEGGTYFQTIPLKTRMFDSTSTFTVSAAPLAPFTDYLPLDPRPVPSGPGVPAELADTLIVLNWNDPESFSKVMAERGERQQAADLLSPVYRGFTEGFDTLDLKEAKALLDQLGA